jgi:hypothetical protein
MRVNVTLPTGFGMIFPQETYYWKEARLQVKRMTEQ